MQQFWQTIDCMRTRLHEAHKILSVDPHITGDLSDSCGPQPIEFAT